MAISPEITFEDFRRLVETVQAAIAGMSSLADRVKALEDANNASYAAAVALKENQQQLFEAQKAQQQVNELLKKSMDQLLGAIGNNSTLQ
jgi:predicted RNA-binding Zn ribbon-like protein